MATPVAPLLPAPPEPLAATLRRNLVVAGLVGAGLALRSHNLHRWLPASAMMLWPTLGGHYLEIAYQRWIQPQVPSPAIGALVRVLTWFAGGALFAGAIQLTGRAVGDPQFAHWPPALVGAIGMTVLELIVHTALWIRGRPGIFGLRSSGTR